LYNDASYDTPHFNLIQEVIQLDKEIMKGSIDIFILSVLLRGDSYGYEIVKNIKMSCPNQYDMSEGTLYPALRRLERKDLIESYWTESNVRRKYYRITNIGKSELHRKVSQWKELNLLIVNLTEGLV